jgi:hypothetical protein
VRRGRAVYELTNGCCVRVEASVRVPTRETLEMNDRESRDDVVIRRLLYLSKEASGATERGAMSADPIRMRVVVP